MSTETTPKVVIESKKWFEEAKQLVRNYDFNLVRVEMAQPREHCQFCNTALIYVALIDGVPFFAKTEHPIHKRIGCDCLERVLGNTWKYYGQMQSELKTLKAIVAGEKRKAKYAELYKTQIEYLSVLPETLEGQWLRSYDLRFLFDIRKVLTTGSKIISKNMDNYLRRLIERDVIADFKRRIDTDTFKIGEWSARIAGLLHMIEKVKGSKLHESNGDYDFVNSVLNYLNFNKRLTQPQMESLNRKYEYYSKVLDLH